jgi:hypothetical protein
MDLQFYPTTKALAYKAWKKFKSNDYTRILEPSCGEGHLLVPLLANESYRYRDKKYPVDTIEIDMSRHPILKAKGLNVVGIDFMQFEGASLYSHIIMNPPFSDGIKHVIKAWDILFDGELVAILNAQSVKNPDTKERRYLVDLIEQYGSVEYLADEFNVKDAERQTSVEIALIHLVKKSNFEIDYLAGLKVDDMSSIGLATGYKEINEIAIHQGLIDNTVTIFKAAVKAAKEEVFSAARARYYAGLLGDTMEHLQSKESNKSPDTVKANLKTVREDLQKIYETLKNKAWTQILRSTQVTSRLSSKAQQRLEAEFENVKLLEFTSANIFGFICGLIENSSAMNIEMICDVFDSFTKYHAANRFYYRGWISNSKHKTAAYKIKNTRVILPCRGGYGWSSHPDWDTTRTLSDFDKVFALLDSKSEVALPLADVLTKNYDDLRSGQRIKASYFDIRFYPGAATIHLFPTDKKLIDRFNRMVGVYRKWLPPEGEKVSEAFWLQYEKADTFATKMQAEIQKENKERKYWNTLEKDIESNEPDVKERAVVELDLAINRVLMQHGIDPSTMIESNQHEQPKQLLLAA